MHLPKSPNTRRSTLPALALLPLLLLGCSDDSSTEPEIDPAIFVYVDTVNGSPDGEGTKADPLAGIQVGISRAAELGGDLRVAEGLYLVNASQGSTIETDFAVDMYGGYRNSDGSWTRDPETYVTIIRDVSTAGGDYSDPRSAVVCVADASGAVTTVLDGFRIEGASGSGWTAAVFVREGATVTIRDCDIRVGAAERAFGIKNYSTDRASDALITVENCTVSGGGGVEVEGIYVSRSHFTVRNTIVGDLTATSRVFGIDCGYGDVLITGCTVHAGTAPSRTYALYLNEAYNSAVTGCTIHGGHGTIGSYAIAAMDTEEASVIADNAIDGGTGAESVGIELGWVEVNPAVDNNTITASGGTDRYGIYERDNVSDPVSLTGNAFSAALLSAPGEGVLYRDRTGNTVTDIITIEALNQLDENGLNPAETVSGNTLGDG